MRGLMPQLNAVRDVVVRLYSRPGEDGWPIIKIIGMPSAVSNLPDDPGHAHHIDIIAALWPATVLIEGILTARQTLDIQNVLTTWQNEMNLPDCRGGKNEKSD